MKRAQTANQIFVYILAIVIVGVILLVGYNSISEVINRMNSMGDVDFEKKLSSAVRRVSPNFGQMQVIDIPVSGEYNEVCFITNYESNYLGIAATDPPFADYPIIFESVEGLETPENNVFLLKDEKQFGVNFDIGGIRVSNSGMPLLCFDVVGSLVNIKIEGKGDHVIVSKP